MSFSVSSTFNVLLECCDDGDAVVALLCSNRNESLVRLV